MVIFGLSDTVNTVFHKYDIQQDSDQLTVPLRSISDRSHHEQFVFTSNVFDDQFATSSHCYRSLLMCYKKEQNHETDLIPKIHRNQNKYFLSH